MPVDYLKRILTSRVYDVARESELEIAPGLSARTGCTVLLKREDNQPVFSFKLRGAYNKMATLSRAELKRGVIAASAGNHAQGVALAAARLDCRAVIVMPVTTPRVKIDAVHAIGGARVEIVLHGESYSDAKAHADALATRRRLVFVHPFDDPDVIAGQGTIGMEILRQHPDPIEAIFVAIGGGGLVSGIAAYVKAIRPGIRIIGVQALDSDAMARSLAAGRRITLKDVGLFCDGTAVKQVGKETFRLCRELVDEIVRVDADAVCAAIKDVFQDTRSILEPAGALAVAGMKAWTAQHGCRGKTVVAVACGANMNFDRLRFVAERAEVGEARESVLAVTIPEQRGSFRRFCTVLEGHSITEFNYRMADGAQANLFVGLQVAGAGDHARTIRALRAEGFATLDLSTDELAKQHLRHMIGGRSADAHDELLYRFEFPERPGALLRFLSAMDPGWNISLFHYRNEGADYGRILVGIQVPQADMKDFRAFLGRLGYPHDDESANPAYRLFLRGADDNA
ncbi:threonine ammonia-lyase, biosynthetic [Dokdonella immobilis]|uniref:L-threonine dehydratase n=1 Tax=Dokdonella immobilis TaxID=578942 RepID=A0A1I4VJ56_9GAMM|nr:threonine ammonia-lyase, biosynthetic [Dokdonella immobilis]SFN01193.1 L-threonine ammonia-lyase [Dokdonella immobilis]